MKSIKTIAFVSLLTIATTTSVFASWWNPFTWGIFQRKSTPVAQVAPQSTPVVENTQVVSSTTETVSTNIVPEKQETEEKVNTTGYIEKTKYRKLPKDSYDTVHRGYVPEGADYLLSDYLVFVSPEGKEYLLSEKTQSILEKGRGVLSGKDNGFDAKNTWRINAVLPVSATDKNIIYIPTYSRSGNDIADVNVIFYSYDLLSGILKEIYSYTIPKKQYSDTDVPYALGISGSKLIFANRMLNKPPGTCDNIWDYYQKPRGLSYIDLNEVSKGVQKYVPTKAVLDESHAKSIQCMHDNAN